MVCLRVEEEHSTAKKQQEENVRDDEEKSKKSNAYRSVDSHTMSDRILKEKSHKRKATKFSAKQKLQKWHRTYGTQACRHVCFQFLRDGLGCFRPRSLDNRHAHRFSASRNEEKTKRKGKNRSPFWFVPKDCAESFSLSLGFYSSLLQFILTFLVAHSFPRVSLFYFSIITFPCVIWLSVAQLLQSLATRRTNW